jgi:23S rRNA pseudouridine955/2504/2580 synthase
MNRRPHRRAAAPAVPSVSAEDAAFVRGFLIHDDGAVLAFDKPSGLAVQGGSGVARSLDGLLAAFADRNGVRPKLVHRLDRETSGVIVAARTRSAAAHLSASFAARTAEKTYLAIVSGAPAGDEGRIEIALVKGRSAAGHDVMFASDAQDALPAATRWRVLAARPEAALLALSPETGRLHQLRAHLAAIGHPIAGDAKYGGLQVLAGTPVPRLMLHAARLIVPHPRGGTLDVSAPAPTDFDAAAVALFGPDALSKRIGRA